MNQHRNSLELLTENHSSHVQDEIPEDWTKISSWGVGGRGQLQAKNSLQSSHKSRNHLSSHQPEWRDCCLHRKLSRDTKRVMAHQGNKLNVRVFSQSQVCSHFSFQYVLPVYFQSVPSQECLRVSLPLTNISLSFKKFPKQALKRSN